MSKLAKVGEYWRRTDIDLRPPLQVSFKVIKIVKINNRGNKQLSYIEAFSMKGSSVSNKKWKFPLKYFYGFYTHCKLYNTPLWEALNG